MSQIWPLNVFCLFFFPTEEYTPHITYLAVVMFVLVYPSFALLMRRKKCCCLQQTAARKVVVVAVVIID